MKVYLKWMGSQYLIHATFWSTLFFSLASPVTHKWMMENVSSSLIAASTLVFAVGTIVINSLFEKYGDVMFKWYRVTVILEISVYAVVMPAVGFGWISPITYYIATAFIDVMLMRNILCCNNRMRKLLYDKNIRERYDNAVPVASSAGTIIGSSIGMIGLPLWLGWIFIATAVITGDIFLLIAYKDATK